uniref:Uncharacterized protein n=1 Tax=Cannabis sativa TaxID=3483 RepID=A0A803QHD7_CANSA
MAKFVGKVLNFGRRLRGFFSTEDYSKHKMGSDPTGPQGRLNEESKKKVGNSLGSSGNFDFHRSFLHFCLPKEGGKAFRAKEKEVRGYGVPLPNATGGNDIAKCLAIDVEFVSGSGETIHDQRRKFGRKSKFQHDFINERPLHSIKRFVHVKLYHHPTTFSCFPPFDGMQKLLSHKNIVRNKPSFKEGALIWGDQGVEDSFDYISQDFRNNFINSGANANRPKI